MANRPKDITPAELAIMKELWKHCAVTIDELTQTLYGGSTPSTIATVHKLLVRLEGKGWVVRDSNQRPYQFQAALAREELISKRLQVIADELCGGGMESLLLHLVTPENFGRGSRKRLRNILDEFEK